MPVDTRLTYEDFCLLPSNNRRYEVIEGNLFVTPAPVEIALSELEVGCAAVLLRTGATAFPRQPAPTAVPLGRLLVPATVGGWRGALYFRFTFSLDKAPALGYNGGVLIGLFGRITVPARTASGALRLLPARREGKET